jgi:hypothetical protein
MTEIDEPNRNVIIETRSYLLGPSLIHCHLLDNGMKVIPVDDFLSLFEIQPLGSGDDDFDREREKLERWVYGNERVDADKKFWQDFMAGPERPPIAGA